MKWATEHDDQLLGHRQRVERAVFLTISDFSRPTTAERPQSSIGTVRYSWR